MVRHGHKVSVWVIGVLFGAMAVVAMFSPVFMQSGLMLDCRAGVIGTATLIGGSLMVVPSLLLPCIYRVCMGGRGVLPGVGEMLFSALLGTLCHMWFRRRGQRLELSEILFASAVVGFGTDLLLVLCFLGEMRQTVAELDFGGFITLLLLIPVSMALLSTFILREQYHDELLQAVDDSERRMLHSQKMAAIGQLSHRIAHSILNALAIIMGNAELAKTEVDETGNVVPIMDNIIKAVGNLSAMTGELMAFATPGEIRFQRMELNKCLVGVEHLLAKVIGSQIEVVINGSQEAGVVNVDPNLIEQIIMHMTLNAADAMDGKGRLTITVAACDLSKAERARLQSRVPESDRHSGDFAMLSVQDTGCGMTQEIAERIFEPFFTTKGKSENAGLGLSSVYNIVLKHHGLIDVKTRPGRGTTFFVYLPVVC